MLFKRVKNIKCLLRNRSFSSYSNVYCKHNRLYETKFGYRSNCVSYFVTTDGSSTFKEKINFSFLSVRYISSKKMFYCSIGDNTYIVNDIQTI